MGEVFSAAAGCKRCGLTLSPRAVARSVSKDEKPSEHSIRAVRFGLGNSQPEYRFLNENNPAKGALLRLDVDRSAGLSMSDAERALAILTRTLNERETINRILKSWGHKSRREGDDLVEKLMVLLGLRGLSDIVEEEISGMPVTIVLMDNSVIRLMDASTLDEVFADLPASQT